MGVDAIAAILPALRELEGARTAAAAEAGEWCVTFSIRGRAEDQWVQVLSGSLNFAYPTQEPAEEVLKAVLGEEDAARFELIACEPGSYATFNFEHVEVQALARVVDAVFTFIQFAAPDEGLDVKLECL